VCADTSIGSPLSVAEWTRGATRSIQVLAPGSRQVNVTVVVEAKVASEVVRSSSMS